MWLTLLTLIYLAGFATAALLIFSGHHRSRGAIAWVIALVGLPWLALPLYWVSGKVRYNDYRRSRKETREQFAAEIESFETISADDQTENLDGRRTGEWRAIQKFGVMNATTDNDTTLFSESEQAWDAIKTDLKEASNYILLQSYLLRDDSVGIELGDILHTALARGCKVFVLYDELGSDDLSEEFVANLLSAGVSILGFCEQRRFLPKMRMNFRNHRKVIVVDGRVGYIGGMNLGAEYLDGADEFSAWRDTHMRIEGPCAAALQLSFVEDWRFANKGNGAMEVDSLIWATSNTTARNPQKPDASSTTASAGAEITICSVGPYRKVLSGDVLFTTLLESAQTRLWIATPYFVPDDRVISTLKSAALRGVEVRVIVPEKSDHGIFLKIHNEFALELEPYGIKMYAYSPGFMHQKVLLVDQHYACVGSANFDNRSFRLNFEIVAAVRGKQFAAEVAQMLVADFESSTAIETSSIRNRSSWQKLLARCTRLLAPTL